ncbi:MAG: GAF domain-containing protein [Candidatus Scalinduaceae bacterium]
MPTVKYINSSGIKNNEGDSQTNKTEIKNLHYNMKGIEKIGIALNSVFKIEKLYKLILDITTDVLEANYASLMILEGDSLYIKSSIHLPKEIIKQTRVRVGVGISGWVALKGEPLVVKDIENNIKFKKRNNKRYLSKSFISMPIIHNNKVLGVINVNDKNNNELFGEEDVETLKIILKYAAIAIRNAHLIEQSGKHTIIDKLEGFYNNDKNKFLPVTLQSLKSGPFSTNELYLHSQNNGKNNYVLYWKGGDSLFVNEKREEFVRRNINRLFVPKNGRKQYLRFMETNLERIVEDNDVGLKEKYHIVNNVAINIANDVSTAPDGVCNIERSKHWVCLMADFIFNSQDNFLALVGVMSHNGNSFEHFINDAMLGLIFVNHLGLSLDESKKLGLGLFLQDIGMRKIDPLIINKPTRLSKDEFIIVKKHPEIGFQTLQDTGKIAIESYLLALNHHENFDGSGYPYGLKGVDIDYNCRISRIIDVYNALTFNRPYASANSPDKACMIMRDVMKGAFDTDVLDSFIDFLRSVQVTTNTTSSNRPIKKVSYC